MKKKQGLLVMLLGCLVSVTAIAGVLAWQKPGTKDGESRSYLESGETSEQLLWNDETTVTKEETKQETEQTNEETQKPGGILQEAQAETETEAETENEQPAAPGPEMAVAETEETDGEAPAAAEEVRAVAYDGTNRLIWPVEGSVLLDYSMEHTIYFPTLDEYKCSPAVLLQGEAGTPVKAPADALVKTVGSDEELGNYVTLDLGNGYEAVCGQLEEPALSEGDFVEAGSVIGTLAEPTKYYVVEGTSLYFEVTKDGAPIDPLELMQ